MLMRLAAFALILSTSLAASAATPAEPGRAAVKAALAHRRAHNLASLHTYVTTGVYPHNTYRTGPLNVWRDARGHLCAAATMIALDGKSELVAQTGDTNVNIRLLDVTAGPLLDWMLTSGLTIEEIDRIQAPGFMPDQPTEVSYRNEDAKLRVDYGKTEAYLKQRAAADLDEATTRLMAHPDLARALVNG